MSTVALHNFHPYYYYCLLVFASGGLWRPNSITGHLTARSLAALATLAALAALISNVLIFILYNLHPYYCLLVFASGGLWRPNRITGRLKVISLAALATLAALAALVSIVLIFALHNCHPYYCLLGFASGGLWRPNYITGHLKARSLAALVSNVLIFSLHNFHPYYCLLGEASGGQIAL